MSSAPPTPAAEDIPRLIETLLSTERQLVELTRGEVDAVTGRDGRTFLLQRAQEQLRHREATRQEAILNALPAHIALLDSHGLIISMNEAWRQFGGARVVQSPGLGIGLNYLENCDRSDGAGSAEAHQVAAGIRAVLAGGTKDFSIEYACPAPAGPRWFLLMVTPLTDNHLPGAVVMHVDITDRKRAEEKLRRSEVSLAAAQRLAQLGSWEIELVDATNLASCPTRWSDELFRIFAFVPAQFLPTNQRALAMIHREDLPRVTQAFDQLIRAGTSYDVVYRIICGDGQERIVLERAELDKSVSPPLLSGTVQDITQRARTEAERTQSEERFTKIFRSSPIAIAYGEAGHQGGFIDVNERWTEFFGYTRAEAIGRTARDLNLWVDLAAQDTLLAQVEVAGVVTNFECLFRHKTGSIKTALLSVEILHLGPIEIRLTMFVDITNRKRDEESLRMQGRVLESMVEGVTVVNESGTLLFSNPACDAMFGYPRGALIGRHISVLNNMRADEGLAFTTGMLRQVFQTGNWSGEIPNVKRDGKPFVTRVHVSAVDLAGKKCAIAVSEDVTETKQLESQLLRAQRMESVGGLAGGIAHDMNNILAPIMMAAPLLRHPDPGMEHEKIIAMIEVSAKRGADLVKQLLFFGRGVEGQRSVVQMKNAMREIHEMIFETFPRSIRIATDAPDEIWPIRADPTQLHQVLLNLCVNARDAMPEGGGLSLVAVNAVVDEAFPGRSVEATPGPYVCIVVADTGVGIPAGHRDKIFEPFFTTKDLGKGTGLGLSTVIAIAKGHNGFVTLESEIGHGTTFRVYLPAAPAATEPVKRASAAPVPGGKNETILLVDDEESIRMIAGEMLRRHGYQVLIANDGAQAAVLFSQHADEIEVVVTDFDMPFMDGLSLIRVLKNIDPGVKIILSTGIQSGFRSEARLSELAALGVRAFLSKPYSAEKILSAIHALIGSPATQ
jgi:PAS domain S-box-containing protein